MSERDVGRALSALTLENLAALLGWLCTAVYPSFNPHSRPSAGASSHHSAARTQASPEWAKPCTSSHLTSSFPGGQGDGGIAQASRPGPRRPGTEQN